MNRPFQSVVGAFRMLRRRAKQLRVNGLAIWADAGERGALAFASNVQAKAHRAELRAIELKRRQDAITADGQVTAKEMPELIEISQDLTRVAEDCHDITEMTKP